MLAKCIVVLQLDIDADGVVNDNYKQGFVSP